MTTLKAFFFEPTVDAKQDENKAHYPVAHSRNHRRQTQRTIMKIENVLLPFSSPRLFRSLSGKGENLQTHTHKKREIEKAEDGFWLGGKNEVKHTRC